MPDATPMVRLYNPAIKGWHDVPDHPAVIQDFQDRGWETPEESADRAAAEAEQLRGKALADALEQAGLSTSGTADEKRARLAEYQAESAITTTEEEEAE